MNPAASIIFFSTLAGTAQGLLVTLAIAVLAGAAPSESLLLNGIGTAELLLVLALACSFLHLGQKRRAWRAILMWRTSWMSREVIVLPVLLAAVGAWWLAVRLAVAGPLLPALIVLLGAALWYCTAMIYACLRFVQEWAHPLTVVNYTLLGLSSGLLVAGALATASGESVFADLLLPWAAAVTVVAAAGRACSLVRNSRLKPRSTLQSATGIQAARLEQKSMGMSAGSFNTREFFHRASARGLRSVKIGFQLFAFALPLLLLWSAWAGEPRAWLVAGPIQYLGLLGERWFFFAQARHPQNLYYQVVS